MVEESFALLETQSAKSKTLLEELPFAIGQAISQSGTSVQTSRSRSRHKLFQCTKCELAKRRS